VPNYSLSSLGASVGIHNHLEISVAHEVLNVNLGGLSNLSALGNQAGGLGVVAAPKPTSTWATRPSAWTCWA